MVTFEIGDKLYTCPEFSLLVFPTEEMAAAAMVARAAAAEAAVTAAAYYADCWSKELNCHVSFIPAGQVFCVVEIGGMKNGYNQVHVISGVTMGWINEVDWLNIEEMVA